MSIRFVTDSKRAKGLRRQHRDKTLGKQPLTAEAIDFQFDYIETLEAELERALDVRFTDTITSLAEQDSYSMARATAGLRHHEKVEK